MKKRCFLPRNALLISGDLLLAGAAFFAARFAAANPPLSYAAVLQFGGNVLVRVAATGLIFYLCGLFSLEKTSRQEYPALLLRLAAAMSVLFCLVLLARASTGGLSGASANLTLALALQFLTAAVWHFVFWRAARAQRQLGKILLHRHRR